MAPLKKLEEQFDPYHIRTFRNRWKCGRSEHVRDFGEDIQCGDAERFESQKLDLEILRVTGAQNLTPT